MRSHSVIGLFCDDIRQEKSGQDTIIGVMADSLAVPAAHVLIPKLCIYIRFGLNAETKPKLITITLVRPDSLESVNILIEQDIISRAFEESEKDAPPHVGIVSKAIMSPFPIENGGRFNIVVNIDGEEEICGSLLVKILGKVD